jgi:hypothetical protein
VENILDLLNLQMGRIDALEIDCQQLCNMVIPQHVDYLSRDSNNLVFVNSFHPIPGEEDSRGHPLEPMEIKEQGTLSCIAWKETQYSLYFNNPCIFM